MQQPQPPPYNQPYPVTAQPAPAPQPQASVNMMSNTVVVNQSGGGGSNSLVLVPKDKLMSRDWSSGCCSCLNEIGSCILGTLCCPILMCRITNRLNECALLPCFVPGAFIALRTKLRTMGGIRGTICSDCVMTSCCGPCVACQMSREMDIMGL